MSNLQLLGVHLIRAHDFQEGKSDRNGAKCASTGTRTHANNYVPFSRMQTSPARTKHAITHTPRRCKVNEVDQSGWKLWLGSWGVGRL